MPAGKGVLISTPWPVESLTGELFERNFGDPTTALVLFGPTTLLRSEKSEDVERERLRDPENAAREFDCEMGVLGSSNVFDNDAITASINSSIVLPVVSREGSFSFGGDLALTRDASALVGACTKEITSTIVSVTELRPMKNTPLKMSEVIATFAEVIKGYGEESFTADGWSREAAREFAGLNQIRIVSALEGNEGKVTTYAMAASQLREGRVVLPPHPRLIAQLRAVRSKPMSGGKIQIISPRRSGSGHGDIASAAVLALYGAVFGSSASTNSFHHHYADQWTGILDD